MLKRKDSNKSRSQDRVIAIPISEINVYVDESGDLGFGDKASESFVVAYVIIRNHRLISKKTKACLKNLNKHHNCHLVEFKFTRDNDQIRPKFLNLISKLEIDVGQIAIKKIAVKTYLRENKGRLYNFLIADIIAKTILTNYDFANRFNLHLDLSMSKASRDDFDSYFNRKISYLLSEMNITKNIAVKTFHDFSHQEPCIQIADYISGSLYQLYGRGNCQYYEIIKNKILYTKTWGTFNEIKIW